MCLWENWRRFLRVHASGIISWDSCILLYPNAAIIQTPLHQLLMQSIKQKDKTLFPLILEIIHPFEDSKHSLSEAAKLVHPITSGELVLSWDTSDKGISVVLQQQNNVVIGPLGFFSRYLTQAQKNYSTYDHDLLAMYEAIRYFHPLIEGINFKINTDHELLTRTFLQKPETASP